MSGKTDESNWTASRRAVLGTAAAVSSGLASGCVGTLQSLVGGNGPTQLSLTVKTVPADTDAVMTRIARQLVERLTAVGVDAKVELKSRAQLRRDVLINNEFDIYVEQYPDHHDPDFTRPLLNSVFTNEAGWQNPFDFSNITIDEQLSAQRTSEGNDRRLIVGDLQREIAHQQPLGVVAFPEEIWTARGDRFTGWEKHPLTDPLSYIDLNSQNAAGISEDRLRVTTTDGNPTRNLNPISAVHRNRGTFTDLVYDPLGRRYDGSVNPWLAEGWSMEKRDGDTVATIDLRAGLRWHDGQPLTASDIAFTYRFLNDTTLGTGEAAVPAPRLRGRASLVEAAEVHNARTVELQLGKTSPEVAVRAFTVPILPSHIWETTTAEVSVAGIDMTPYATEAIVTSNSNPVGSGVLQFDGSTSGESLVLTRFDDHFLHQEVTTDIANRFDGGLAFKRLSVRIVPSDDAAVELVAADEADATAMSISPNSVSRIGKYDQLDLYTAQSRSFYHIGFNAREAPFGNAHFRRAVMRLLDKEYIVDETLDGYGTPAASPLTGTDWLPADLQWNSEDPEVPFVGEDGNLNEPQAKEVFREAGFDYDNAGRMIDR